MSNIESIIKSINKKYGESTLVELGSSGSVVDYVPSCLSSLNDLLGGGWPIGRMIEISGGESSGKTSLALETIVDFYNHFPDKAIAFIDAEHALDMHYAYHLGVPIFNKNKILFNQPDSAEEAFNIIDVLAKSKEISLIVLDSLTSLEPRKQSESDIGDNHMAQIARMTSDAFKRITRACAENGTTFLIINQQRANITPMGAFGTVTSGGNAIKFYPSLRIKLKAGKVNSALPDEVPVEATVIKTKTGARLFQSTEYTVSHIGAGLNRATSAVHSAVDRGLLIVKGGGHLEWHDPKTPAGKILTENKLRGVGSVTAEIIENEKFRAAICDELEIPMFSQREPMDRKKIKEELIKLNNERKT